MKTYLLNHLILIRFHHWIKNLFIFIPIFFSAEIFDYEKFIDIGLVTFGFCLVAGFIYIINDILDIEYDRLHPTKKLRPIAANILSIKNAFYFGCLILIIGLSIIYQINNNAFFLTLIYIMMNVLYSYKLKKLAIIDFITISVGFVIRIFIGASVAHVELSEWIVLMVFLLSLFIAISKRRDDVVLLDEQKTVNREVIKEYSTIYLDNVLSIVSSILLVSYLMYVTNDDVMKRYDSKLIYLTFIFVLLGILRYSQLSIVYKISGSPIKIFYSDLFLQIVLFMWALSFFIIIYVL